jgi:GMP synthase (glutamine-hydrolysing)
MIVIIDRGSQYTHLIKRNFRDMNREAEIINAGESYEDVKEKIENAERIVLAGGPSSVSADRDSLTRIVAEKVEAGELNVPILGICYGHQMIADVWGGKVEKGKSAEYGVSEITVDDEDIILKGLPRKFKAWVSHFDEVKELPEGFEALAHSETCGIEAMRHKEKPIFAVQFHPEVWHTEKGELVLKNFAEV